MRSLDGLHLDLSPALRANMFKMARRDRAVCFCDARALAASVRTYGSSSLRQLGDALREPAAICGEVTEARTGKGLPFVPKLTAVPEAMKKSVGAALGRGALAGCAGTLGWAGEEVVVCVCVCVEGDG